MCLGSVQSLQWKINVREYVCVGWGGKGGGVRVISTAITCVRACVHVCVRACACMRACGACVCVCVGGGGGGRGGGNISAVTGAHQLQCTMLDARKSKFCAFIILDSGMSEGRDV